MASIRKRADKWQVRIIRKGYNPITKSFQSRCDADRWARHTEARIDQGTFIDTSEAQRTTLAEVIERYRKEVTPSKKGAKQEGYRLDVLKRSKLTKLALAAVRSVDIAQYRDDRGREVAANTVKNEMNTLSAIFEHAKGEWGLLSSNPCLAVRRPTSPRGRIRRLEMGEGDALLLACRASRAWYLYCIVVLALETGARLGELALLRRENVDFKKSVAYLLDTKNGEDRNIPLSGSAIEVLKAVPQNFDGRVFPVSVESIKQAFRAAVIRARMQDFHFHDLRHEAISRFFELGLNPMEVASISGHKTLAMLKRYTHLRAEDLVRKLG